MQTKVVRLLQRTKRVAMASGRRPADLVARDGRWGNVLSGTDVAVAGERIAC